MSIVLAGKHTYSIYIHHVCTHANLLNVISMIYMYDQSQKCATQMLALLHLLSLVSCVHVHMPVCWTCAQYAVYGWIHALAVSEMQTDLREICLISVCHAFSPCRYVSQDLANLNRQKYPWVVVGVHRMMLSYPTTSNHSIGDDMVNMARLQADWFDLFYQYQVSIRFTLYIWWFLSWLYLFSAICVSAKWLDCNVPIA